MQKILFLDRDGTLNLEPEDYQVDALSKVVFYPEVFQYLGRIARELDYELVMVTNQDGLGTESFPDETFWPAQNMIVDTLAGEGIIFSDIIIDRTFAKDHQPTRKPGTALLTKYLEGDYDLANSYVVGDRLTDMQLAKNLGAKGVWMNNAPELGADELQEAQLKELETTIALTSTSWADIYALLKLGSREARVHRQTKETDILIELKIDGTGQSDISTGLGFFDHMLDQIGKHSSCDLEIKVKGDLEVDEHHTIEDTALALGEAFLKALGNKKGISRYGFLLPMDDALAQVAIDFGGRPWIVWDAEFRREKIGDMPTEMFYHFFKSFSDAAKCNLNISVKGDNEHHKIEAIFKALAKSIKMAVKRYIEEIEILPSTKGTL